MNTPQLPAKPSGHTSEAIRIVPATAGDAEERDIPVAEIDPNPDQPRQYFDQQEEQAITDSIAADGQQNAGIAYLDPETGRYQLIAGHRRLRVLRRLGKKTMRLRVLKETPDKAKRSRLELLDNELSKTLSRLEKGFAWDRHIKQVGCTASALAQTLGTSVSTVTRAIKDAERLCPALKDRFRTGTLPPDIAEELLTLPGDAQLAIAKQYPDSLKSKAEVRAAVRCYKNGNGQSAASTSGFSCEESGVRIAVTWTTGAPGASPGQALATAENALKIVLKDLREQGHRGLEKFKDFLSKKAKAARKAADLAEAQKALANLSNPLPERSNNNG